MRLAQWRVLVIVATCLGAAAGAYAQCGPMDVVFAIDTTGSMTGTLDNVKADLPGIIDQIKSSSGGDFRLGLIEIGGPQDGIVVDNDLAAGNLAAVEATIGKLTADGGGGEPEASDEAIHTILNHLKSADSPKCGSVPCQTGDFNGTFRPEATKVIILVTDARPSGYDDNFGPEDEANVVKYATQAGAMGVRIGAIMIPTEAGTPNEDTIVRVMHEWADLSSGVFLRANADGSGTSAAINTIISTCGGGGAVAGSTNLILDPTEVLLSNNESADVNVTLFLPATGDLVTAYTASGLPDDSTIQFLPRTPDVDLTEARTMRITIGPDTPAGTYVVTVKASRDDIPDQFNFVLVFVDCQPPFILGVNDLGTQSQSVPSGQRATLTVVPGGNGPFHYQWYSGHSGITSSPISGATLNALTTPAITAPSEFWVRITNACGTRDSATATVSPR